MKFEIKRITNGEVWGSMKKINFTIVEDKK